MTKHSTPVAPQTLLPAPTSDQPAAHGSVRINAALIADANQSHSPGSLLLTPVDGSWQVTAIGSPDQLNAQIAANQLPAPSTTHDLPDRIIIPALINAHTHLDLTHIGSYPHDPDKGFVPWLDMIRANRLMDDDAITDSVNLGITKSLAGGTIAVGDIAGAPNAVLKDAPIHALARSPMMGTSYLEFFGIGTTATTIIDRLESYLATHHDTITDELAGSGVTFGLSPHATNTISIAVYHWAAKIAQERNIPLCTHLAETLEEREFISKGTGTQRGFLERFGIWDDSILKEIAQGLHPIEHLLPVLAQTPILCAHVNDAPDDTFNNTIEQLARTNTSVAYCPRAHTYFGHYDTLGPHPFEKMLEHGINVTLGTDSIVNLDTPDRISTLDDMRLLSNRNQTRMSTLLKMTTTNPASALGLDPAAFAIAPDSAPAGLISVHCDPSSQDPWSSAMRSSAPPEWLLLNAKIGGIASD